MDLRQLNALVAVAEHKSFSSAARALHTVQSNISTHVARLERELGVTLIDRTTSTLTDAGVVVVQRATRVQRELEALVADVAAVHDEIAGVVRIGVIGTTARWLVPPLLESMAARYPRVRVVVVDATTTSLLPQVHTGQLDLAVVALPVHDPDVESEQLFEEDLLVIAPTDHPLAERDRVTFAELAEHDLLLEPPGTVFRDDLEVQAAKAGVTLRAKAEVDGMRLVASLAFEGFGAAVLPASAAPRWLRGGWKVVAVDGLTGRSVGLIRRRRGLPSAPARAIADTLRSVVAEEAAGQPGIRPMKSST
ncbi:MAG TPA: LysR family transcriptional regulator [Acidimicrobiales bacterium]|jgi:LysR family hydrogen peroxide-inducible transcriptional activator